MLNIFRTNQSFTNALLLIYAFVIRLVFFFHDFDLPEITKQGVLFDILFSPSTLDNRLLNFLLCTILIFIQATLLNLIINDLRMTREPNLYSGLFYVLFCSLISDFFFLNPVILANTFLIFVFYELFQTYRKHEASKNLFNIGFLTGLAGLFYKPSLVLLLPILIGVGILRAFKFKERLVVLIGVCAPFLLAWTWCFWTDQTAYFGDFFKGLSLTGIDFLAVHPIQITKLILVGLLLLWFFVNYWNLTSKKELSTQKYIDILYLCTFFIFLFLLFIGKLQLFELTFFAIPLSYGLGSIFANLRTQIADIIHLLLLFIIGLLFYFEGWLF